MSDPKYTGSNVSKDQTERKAVAVVKSIRPPDFETEDQWDGFKANIQRAWAQGLIPRSIDSVEAALVLALKGRELGLEPLYALSILHLINGKPGMEAQAMLALVYRRYPMAEIEKTSPEEKRHSVCTLRARRSKEHAWNEVTFSIEDAIQMECVGRDKSGKLFVVNKKYPWVTATPDMLWARAASRMVRRVWPECIMGCYTPEELQPKLERVAAGPTIEEIDAKFNSEAPAALPSAQKGVSVLDEVNAKVAKLEAEKVTVDAMRAGIIPGMPMEEEPIDARFTITADEAPPAPEEPALDRSPEAPLPDSDGTLPGDYMIQFGRFTGQRLHQLGISTATGYLKSLKNGVAEGKAIPKELIEAVEKYLKVGI